MIDAVLFDLDDTLYDQRQWLDGAWDAVSHAAEALGVAASALRPHLAAVAAEGSARGGIIDRALARLGARAEVAPLVDAFRSYRAPALDLYPGARAALEEVAKRVPIGLVTDGDVAIQRGKITSLGLEDAFSVVVLSDELGRHRRKPHPAPFVRAFTRLGLPPGKVVFVGDHPEKDVAGAHRAGMRSVRVLTGEYAGVDGSVQPWAVAADVATAVRLLAPRLVCSAPSAG